MKLYKVLPIIIALATLSPAPEGVADIYRYTDADGVTCFTDVPTTHQAVVVMKDSPQKKTGDRLSVRPQSLPASGIAKKRSSRIDNTIPVTGKITSLVGYRNDPIDGKVRFHNGVDIAVPSGTPVRPVLPGSVVFSGMRPGYGNIVIMSHDDGTVTLYAHNSINMLSEGSYAAKETTIALSGSTGRSTGPHLHFEAWKDGVNVTHAFVDGDAAEVAVIEGHSGGDDGIRRSIAPDGSLLFTDIR